MNESSLRPVPVLLMSRELGIGGTERQLSIMARSLDRTRFEPHVGCFHARGLRRPELEASGVPIVDLSLTSFKSPSVVAAAVLKLHRYVRAHGIRLVHAFDQPAGLFAVPVLWARRSVVVISSQRAFRELTPSRQRRLMRLTDKMSRAIIVNSEQVRRHLIEDERVPPERILVCYNGIDIDVFRPAAERTRCGALQAASLVIGIVCALRPEKDLATLLRAFALVRGDYSGLRLLIAGDGPCQPELRRLAAHLSIAEEVVFAPAQPDVMPYLNAIDIFVLPSISEALSNSLMEAMACGCAVIASRTGGNPELVEHDVTGLLCEKRDVNGLAQCLRRLAGSPELRRRLSEAATAVIRRKFSIVASAERMGAIYTQVLQKR